MTTPPPQPSPVYVEQKKSNGCLIAALIVIGAGVLVVGGCTLVGILGLGRAAQEISKNVEEQKKAKEKAVKDLVLADFKWSKGEFGSIMTANFTIANNGENPIKDIEIKCTHFAPSGTEIDSNTRTIYELIEPGEVREFKEFNMGFIHQQAEKSIPQITSAVVVE